MAQPNGFTWTPPATNTDGTPIVVPLDYELGELDVATNNYVPLATIVGVLQAGRYEAPVGDMVFNSGQHTLALRAVAHDEDDVLNSVWSNAASFVIVGTPNAPLAFAIV